MAMMTLLAQPAANSDDPVSIDPLLEAPGISQPDEQILVAGGGSWSLPAYDDCHPCDPSITINQPNISYKHLDGAILDLYLDEYYPNAQGSPPPKFPALILVHGGGGFRGCKWNERVHAQDLTVDPSGKFTRHFIVLAIDYRLACDPTDPNLIGPPESPTLRYCGWTYNRPDNVLDYMDNYQYGPGIHDVEWAMDYAWHHPNDYCQCWNGKVAMIGGSWGGNLAFMASQRLKAVSSSDQVNALGAWSGSLEVQQQHGPNPPGPPYHWPCDLTEANDYNHCGGGTDFYLGCVRFPYPNDSCKATPPHPAPPFPTPWQGWYSDASPYGVFGAPNPTGWPTKVFFANGGGAGSPELQSLQSAVDFQTWLAQKGWIEVGSNPNFQFCVVLSPKHAEQYLNDESCLGEPTGYSVFRRTIAFITPAVA